MKNNVIRLADRRKPEAEPPRTDEERIARVRQSLDKINRLMSELKQLSGEKKDGPQ